MSLHYEHLKAFGALDFEVVMDEEIYLSYDDCMAHFGHEAVAALEGNLSEEQIKWWFHTPNSELENTTPYAILMSVYGYSIPNVSERMHSNMAVLDDIILDGRWS